MAQIFDAGLLQHLQEQWQLDLSHQYSFQFYNEKITGLYAHIDTLVGALDGKMAKSIQHISAAGDRVVVDAKEKFQFVDSSLEQLHGAIQELKEDYRKFAEATSQTLKLTKAQVKQLMVRDESMGNAIKELQVENRAFAKRLEKLEGAGFVKRESVDGVEQRIKQISDEVSDVVQAVMAKGAGPVAEGIGSHKEEDIYGAEFESGYPSVGRLGQYDEGTSSDFDQVLHVESSAPVIGPRPLGTILESPATTSGPMSDVQFPVMPQPIHSAGMENPLFNASPGHSSRSKIKVPQPEKFSGTRPSQNVALWLRQVGRYCATQRYSLMETLHVAVGLLTDSAALWADTNFEEIQRKGWSFLEQGLLQQFQPMDVRQAALDRLEALSFEENGDIMKHVRKFRELVVQVPSMGKEEQLSYFLRGMPMQIKQFIRLNMDGAGLDAIVGKLQSIASLQATMGTASGSQVPALMPKNRSSWTGEQSTSGGGFSGRGRFGNRGRNGGRGRFNNSGRYTNSGRSSGQSHGGRSSGAVSSIAAVTETRKDKGRKVTCFACESSDHRMDTCPVWAAWKKENLKGGAGR